MNRTEKGGKQGVVSMDEANGKDAYDKWSAVYRKAVAHEIKSIIGRNEFLGYRIRGPASRDGRQTNWLVYRKQWEALGIVRLFIFHIGDLAFPFKPGTIYRVDAQQICF